MAGKIKNLIDLLIQQRSQGNRAIVYALRVKLILKGINPDDYSANSPDDPETIASVKAIAQELGVEI